MSIQFIKRVPVDRNENKSTHTNKSSMGFSPDENKKKSRGRELPETCSNSHDLTSRSLWRGTSFV